jgi:hypothetical protein
MIALLLFATEWYLATISAIHEVSVELYLGIRVLFLMKKSWTTYKST